MQLPGTALIYRAELEKGEMSLKTFKMCLIEYILTRVKKQKLTPSKNSSL